MRGGLLGYPTVLALASDHTCRCLVLIGGLHCNAHKLAERKQNLIKSALKAEKG